MSELFTLLLVLYAAAMTYAALMLRGKLKDMQRDFEALGKAHANWSEVIVKLQTRCEWLESELCLDHKEVMR